MSLILRNNPVGIDCAINFMQDMLWDSLNPLWGDPLGSVDWESVPRVYKTRHLDENGTVFYKPEYMSGTKEYNLETLFNDKVDVTSFFLKDDQVSFDNGDNQTDVSLIFSCDITKLYPNETQKPDELMHNDIIKKVLTVGGDSWELNSMFTGVEDVYREFKKDDLNWSSTSHRHLVRFDFTVHYSTYC
jgi:hypothetical protein